VSRSERPGLRYELKLVSDEAFSPELRMLLRLDRAGIRSLFPERIVQSLYLDTPFQKHLQDNLAGLSRREKLRLRWYGPSGTRVRATLERKCRENSMGWKETAPLAGPIDVEGAERHDFMNALAQLVDARWRASLAGFEPVQWVHYRREYFISADQRVRLTLDRELCLADQRRLTRLSERERSPSPRVLVLELKFAPEDLGNARDILDRLPIPLGRCSKFVLASEPSSGPLPSEFEV